MSTIVKRRTPADMLRAAARWIDQNASELVSDDGAYVAEDGLGLDVTIHLQSASFTTVSVDGHTNYIVLERKVVGDGSAQHEPLPRAEDA